MPENEFHLQWHVTAKCDQHCKHCYMYDSPTYASQIGNEMPLEKCEETLADFEEFAKEKKFKGEISFSGGDPLLKPGFPDLLEKASAKFMTGILGNPYHVDDEVAGDLKRRGLKRYQISIDGMEKTHDYLRRQGSFKESLRALGALKKAGLTTAVMFTASRLNAPELCDVLRLMAEKGADTFTFTRLVPTGTGSELKEQMIPPAEYKKLLEKVLETLDGLDEKKYGGFKARVLRREYLFRLLFWEKGRLAEYEEIMKKHKLTYGGCGIGGGFTVLADGTVLACRRLPFILGKTPEQKFSRLFESPFIKMMKDWGNFEKCSSCEIVGICRGNPCVACAVAGSPFAPDPQCWKGLP